ncbi:hypothetical protein [Corynebacterium oculi]|uniref:hypothetical protein n=1 Tax=Corynebacterium oculi TaxID=1544416 RepID=UPI001237515D|nr:hypothetical protein [Corynebacterium oculi]
MIAMKRTREIGSAIEQCQVEGGEVYLITLTVRHHAGQSLQDVWEAVSAGWRGVTGNTRWTGRKKRGTEGERDRLGVAGTARVVEATHGDNGWHVHVHALVFLEKPLIDTFSADLLGMPPRTDEEEAKGKGKAISRIAKVLGLPENEVSDAAQEAVLRTYLGSMWARWWIDAVKKAGFASPGHQGFDIRRISDGGNEYLGDYLVKNSYTPAEKLGIEVASGMHTKKGGGRTPFQILADAIEEQPKFGFPLPKGSIFHHIGENEYLLVETKTGEVVEMRAKKSWRLWHEWERVSKGKRQIMWSRRVKKNIRSHHEMWNRILDARGQEMSDQEIAEQGTLDDEFLGEISRESWYKNLTWRPSLISGLLESLDNAGEKEARSTLIRWADEHGVELNS